MQSVEALPKEDSCVATSTQHFLTHSVFVYDCLEPATSASILVTFHFLSKVAIPIGTSSRSSPSDGKKYYDFNPSDPNYLNNFNTGGLHGTEEGSIVASRPTALGSNPGSADIFLSENISLYCLVSEQY